MVHLVDKNSILWANHLLDQHELQLHQLESTPPLAPRLCRDTSQQYLGRWEEIANVIKARLEFIQSRRILLENLIFMLHDTIHHFVSLSGPEELRNACVKTLNQNKLLIHQRIEDLTALEQVYQSLTIEPGILSLPNGEHADPFHFRVHILPPSSFSIEKKEHMHAHWLEELLRLESLLMERILLSRLPLI